MTTDKPLGRITPTHQIDMPSGGNVLVDDAIELVDSLTALVGQPFTPFPILKTNARQPVYGIRLKVTG